MTYTSNPFWSSKLSLAPPLYMYINHSTNILCSSLHQGMAKSTPFSKYLLSRVRQCIQKPQFQKKKKNKNTGMETRCFQIRLILKTTSFNMYGWLCNSASDATKEQKNQHPCDSALVRCLKSTLKKEMKQLNAGNSVKVLLTKMKQHISCAFANFNYVWL